MRCIMTIFMYVCFLHCSYNWTKYLIHDHYLLNYADNLYTILESYIPGISSLNHEPLSYTYRVKINVNFIISLLIYKAGLDSKQIYYFKTKKRINITRRGIFLVNNRELLKFSKETWYLNSSWTHVLSRWHYESVTISHAELPWILRNNIF